MMALIRRLRRGYGLPEARGDLIAGVTVAVLFVPQALAYAMLAGLPPVTGLYAAAFPALIYALFAPGRYLSVGPVAIVSLLVAGGLETLATPFSPQYHQLALVLSAMVGAMWLSLALLRAGFLANFVSHPVVVGFNAAAALLTAASQFKPLLGIEGVTTRAEHPWPVLLHLADSHPVTAAVGLLSLVALLVLGRWTPKVPGPLVVAVVGIAATALFGLDRFGLAIVGEVPRGLPAVRMPTTDTATMMAMLPTAATIALVGYASSITVVKALASQTRETVRPNRELWALGLASGAGAFLGGFPVSGGLARSALQSQAGARTRMAGVIASLGVLGALLWLAPGFEPLPRAALAAIIIRAVLPLIDIRAAWQVFRTRKEDFLTLAVALVGTLWLGLAEGFLLGMALSLLLFVGRTAKPHSAELGRIPGTYVYRNVHRFSAEVCPQAGILRIDAPLYYANARFLEDRVEALFHERSAMQILVLECSAVNDLDSTATQTLARLVSALRTSGRDLHMVGAIGPVRDILARSGLADTLGAGNLHRNIIEAAPVIMDAISRDHCQRRCTVSAFPACTLIPRIGGPQDRPDATADYQI